MGKYGEAALLAVEQISNSEVLDPPQAWRRAVVEVFPTQQASQEKGCPKGAFLGLCESGAIKNIEPGSYTRSKLNKSYALKAVELLRINPALADDQVGLWDAVMEGESKTENSQMDVVVSLWRRGFIKS